MKKEIKQPLSKNKSFLPNAAEAVTAEELNTLSDTLRQSVASGAHTLQMEKEVPETSVSHELDTEAI